MKLFCRKSCCCHCGCPMDNWECDLAINNGRGDISYHNWNVKDHGRCATCGGYRKRKNLVKRRH